MPVWADQKSHLFRTDKDETFQHGRASTAVQFSLMKNPGN